MVFNDFPDELDLRDEGTFNNFEYPNHQRERSPLVDAGISCIHGLFLDYMHLVMLGVVKRILKALIQPSIGSKARLSINLRELFGDSLLSLKGCLPSEFARQPRFIDELDFWKATELRKRFFLFF